MLHELPVTAEAAIPVRVERERADAGFRLPPVLTPLGIRRTKFMAL